MKKAEILSPVGNGEMLIAAVRSGADAVYLGAKDFSARRNAENFDLEALDEAIKYCHIRGVKAYLTLNILIKDSELEQAFSLAKNAYNLGIDGIIIEDLGLARLLKKQIPNLKLHASTQMSVHSPSALPILKKLGFCQVVAAREMSKEELRVFCKRADELGITVEVFVHGALCMSVSGQCLLSAFLGSRSGNRGLCAGPCRLPFGVENGTGYDLSLKDLSLIDYIGELYELGVKSFKIEGRMKRPEYVAAATAACKQAFEKGNCETSLALMLKNVFSRQGFTDGYYQNQLGRQMFGIRTKEDVIAADKALPVLHELYRKERQNIPVGIKARIKRDEPISLTLENGDISVTVLGEKPHEAQNKPLDYDTAFKNLSKFGSTPYYNCGGTLNLDDGLFVSASILNDLRRRGCEMLDLKRSEVKNKSDAEYFEVLNKGEKTNEIKLYARFENPEQIPEDLGGISAIIYPLEQNPERLQGIKNLLIADIPRGIISEENIRQRLKLFKANGFKTALCGNLAAVQIAQEEGFEVIADTGLNLSNSHSLALAEELGITQAVISPEQTLGEISRLSSNIKTGILGYGNIPLMLFKNCPLKNGKGCRECDKNGVITDRLGIEFPIRCRMGYSELLNSLPLWLADRKTEIHNLDFLVLYFTKEDAIRVSEVINAYKNQAEPDIKHTRGLYYRGTL